MTDRALSREWVHARMTKLVMCSIFSLAVAAVLPACTSLERMTATASAETVTMTNTPTDQLDNKEAARRAQPTMEIGATLREMAWMMNGVVRVGFWTPTHQGVLLKCASN
jgi:2-methylaconitate cis-trans-isomerase PrpF